ncbi:MAG: glycosyltransferase family 9 protein [Proteobacteria bacterium]|nr:glycosyltransferase family 9 protein [Pseudomonadota bacterium]
MTAPLATKPLFSPARPARSVLVYVGLDRVGDGLMKLPFVHGLRRAFPDARITWVAGKETSVYASVLASAVHGLIDEVVEHAGIGERASELLRRPLPGRRFDLIIDTQRIFWASLSLMRVPHRAFISPAARFILSSRRPPAGYRYPRSMLRQMLDLLELASAQRVETPAGLAIALDARYVQEAECALPAGPCYVGIAPGAGGGSKCWPLERFMSVGKTMANTGRTPVFILGPREDGWRQQIAGAVPDARFPLQETGGHGFAPELTIALATRFTAALANDSGTGHMFAAAGIPMVSLFGSTVPEKFAPMTPRLIVLKAPDFGGREVDRIPEAAVCDALEALLQERGWGAGRSPRDQMTHASATATSPNANE